MLPLTSLKVDLQADKRIKKAREARTAVQRWSTPQTRQTTRTTDADDAKSRCRRSEDTKQTTVHPKSWTTQVEWQMVDPTKIVSSLTYGASRRAAARFFFLLLLGYFSAALASARSRSEEAVPANPRHSQTRSSAHTVANSKCGLIQAGFFLHVQHRDKNPKQFSYEHTWVKEWSKRFGKNRMPMHNVAETTSKSQS